MDGINQIGLRSNLDCCGTKEAVSYSDTLMGNLKRKQLKAKTELEACNAAIKALEENPKITEVLELIALTNR